MHRFARLLFVLALVAFLVVSLAIEGIVAIKCSRVEVR